MQPEPSNQQTPTPQQQPSIVPASNDKGLFDTFHVWIRNIFVLDLVVVLLIWRPMSLYNEQLYWEINDNFGVYIFVVSMIILTLFTITAIIAVQRKRNAKNQS